MKHLFSLYTFVAFSTLTAITSFASAEVNAAEITVEVSGIEQAKGHILIMLSNDKGNWMGGAAKGGKAARVAAQLEKVSVKFEDVPEGDYAVSVLHDINDDGKMNSNEMGMPIEAFGFSNNAVGNYGPPTFEQAKVKVTSDKQVLAVKLN